MEPGESREVEAWGTHVVIVDEETVCLQRGAVSEGKQGKSKQGATTLVKMY